jgi:hypothetical protein
MAETDDTESKPSLDPFLDRPEHMAMGDIQRLPLAAHCTSDRRSPRHAAQVVLVISQYQVTQIRALCDEHAQEEIGILENFLESHQTNDDPNPGSYKLISLDLAGQILRDTEGDVDYEEDEPDQ